MSHKTVYTCDSESCGRRSYTYKPKETTDPGTDKWVEADFRDTEVLVQRVVGLTKGWSILCSWECFIEEAKSVLFPPEPEEAKS